MDSMPERGTRVDTVFGAPVRFDPVPWPRTKRLVDEVRAQIQQTLADHVRLACDLTGQTLPALPVNHQQPTPPVHQ
jgi:1-acyl-sn-glycerol-3-phosphate acyltransferase